MTKVSIPGSNAFCPQALYLYGTYKEDGRANYGLFCWACYAAVGPQMKFVACIGEDKVTRDRIRANRMFSATVVTQSLLPKADWCGCTPGHTVDKEDVVPSETGEKLAVPVPVDGQWTMELQVDEILRPAGDGNSEIYICSIVNVRADERLTADTSLEERMAVLAPVVTLKCQYFGVQAASLGGWGTPMTSL